MATPKEHARAAAKPAPKNLVIHRLKSDAAAQERPLFEVTIADNYLRFPPASGKRSSRKFRGARINYAALAKQSLYQHSQTVASRAPAEVLRSLATDVRIDVSVLAERLGIPKSTLSRKLADNDYLNVSDGERVLGLVRLIGQVEAMVEGADGAAEFDAAKWFGRWLMEPLPAIGKAPIELLETSTGLLVIERQLQMMQSGSYA